MKRLLVQVVRRAPWTVLAALALLGVALWWGAHRTPTSDDLVSRVGVSHDSLRAFEWRRIFTSALYTGGGGQFWLSLMMLVACVGWAEWQLGTARSFLLFWSAHLVSLALTFAALAAVSKVMVHPVLETLRASYGVGPSGGYYGCLGAMSINHRYRWRVAGVIAAVLLFRLLLSSALAPDLGRLDDDLCHLIAFAFGLSMARWLGRGGDRRAGRAA